MLGAQGQRRVCPLGELASQAALRPSSRDGVHAGAFQRPEPLATPLSDLTRDGPSRAHDERGSCVRVSVHACAQRPGMGAARLCCSPQVRGKFRQSPRTSDLRGVPGTLALGDLEPLRLLDFSFLNWSKSVRSKRIVRIGLGAGSTDNMGGWRYPDLQLPGRKAGGRGGSKNGMLRHSLPPGAPVHALRRRESAWSRPVSPACILRPHSALLTTRIRSPSLLPCGDRGCSAGRASLTWASETPPLPAGQAAPAPGVHV